LKNKIGVEIVKEADLETEHKIDNGKYAELLKSPKKRMSVGRKIAIALSILFGLVIITAASGYIYVNHLLSFMEKEKIAENNTDLGIGKQSATNSGSSASSDSSSKNNSGSDKIEDELANLPYYYEGVSGITNIALFGIDAEQGTTGRSDTIMILTIDTKSNKIKLSSIVRDSYVNIPGRGMDKINHAYAFGGAQLALKTINTNFHLDIRSYITVNFTSLPQIIDKIGGVEITITEKEFPNVSGIDKAGTYLLNGSQALQFSRIRYIDSDFERSRRQRDVVEAAIKKMFGQSLTSYPGLMKEVFPLLRTNMASGDMLKMATDTILNNIRTIEKMRYPTALLGNGQMINNQYYFVFDRRETLIQMGKYIYLDEK